MSIECRYSENLSLRSHPWSQSPSDFDCNPKLGGAMQMPYEKDGFSDQLSTGDLVKVVACSVFFMNEIQKR
jgi:hypothetical protein